MKIKQFLNSIGPGLLFAGAAIGVSHLVQSTRAGADFGFGLIWALILINVLKYPFFQFGARYANATGTSLLEGYAKIHKGILVAYFFIYIASMFTIQAAVTIVTAGLAMNIFGLSTSPVIMTSIILLICFVILIIGRYKLLDNLMKIVVVLLTITTIGAVIVASCKNQHHLSFSQQFIFDTTELTFLIAFMGWMPAPLDVSIWQSLWSEAKQKENTTTPRNLKTTLFDFNVGYITTLVLGVCFLSMGALVMFQSGNTFSKGALGFSKQLIHMYTDNLGSWSFVFIAFAAFTTMFSTTLTALDASPRAMQKTTDLLLKKSIKNNYMYWLITLVLGSIAIISFFTEHMLDLIKIATVLSFVTAPFFAIINYLLVTDNDFPKEYQPKIMTKILSWIGIVFLTAFSIWYICFLMI